MADAQGVLRESNRLSPANDGSADAPGKQQRPTAPGSLSEKENTIAHGQENDFLAATSEKGDLNQYWYSRNTIETLCDAIREGLQGCNGSRVAFLSTPSLFFSLSLEEREHCTLFDCDSSWASCPGFQFYDYNDPTSVPGRLHGSFDLIVIDPPFITNTVWECYAITAKLLAREGTGHILATTVWENALLMKDLFGCEPAVFRPSIPRLVYQYSVFANFESAILAQRNAELPDEA
ncbi:hypothetical protein ACHAXT_008981 [Thalassiosira profunda]